MESQDLKIPDDVHAASQCHFTGGVTGFLHRPQVWGFCLVGRVYHDGKGRFKSGRLIRTSNVCEFHEELGYLIALTATGSRYVLVDVDPQTDHLNETTPFDPVTPERLS
ncbi:hypothetical protein BUE60_17810 [Pseudomonas syringae pv. actinidiae]|nr:hypothetical protein BUE61_17585 [Pseudomonas syringae pv. actinidiae]PBK51870.1 hypothetical protein BUE60_17810 [Pseudomonas syringae pv. actinidiae]